MVPWPQKASERKVKLEKTQDAKMLKALWWLPYY